jgi:hypothetical protein
MDSGYDYRLHDYESEHLIRSTTNRRRLNRVPKSAHAKEITAHVRQSRSYFDASRNAPLLIKPLLQFYGVQALTRAVIMLRTGKRECAVAQAHGLSCEGWGTYLNEEAFDPGMLVMRAGKSGTFPDLISATDNMTALHVDRQAHSPAYRVDYYHRMIPSEVEFSLFDILSRLPETADIITRSHGGCNKAAIKFFTHPKDGHIFVDLSTGLNELSGDAGEFLKGFIDPQHHTKYDFRENGSLIPIYFRDLPDFWDVRPRGVEDFGHYVIVKKFPTGFMLSKFAALYALSYALGSFSRYHPTAWEQVTSGGLGSKYYPTIRCAIDIVDKNFQMMALELIEKITPYSFRADEPNNLDLVQWERPERQ